MDKEFQPCSGCGKDHDPEDCFTGDNMPPLDPPQDDVCEECEGKGHCYGHCKKYE